MTSEPSVAVVILNWNGRELLRKFLPSVVQTKYANLQIIVGDNASTDDSINFVKQNYPQIKVIKNEENYGFADGYNQILAQVEADYFVLLNSDVEVPADWITPVIALMQSDEKIAVAQPKIKYQRDKAQFEHAGAAGGFIDKYGYTFCRGRIFDQTETDLGQYNQSTPIFWASGAAFFIKKKAWQAVKGFDADFFAHMEEIDLCWRLKNLGYEISYCAAAEVYHVGGSTLNVVNPQKTYLNFRNNLIMLQKNLTKKAVNGTLFVRFWLDFAALVQLLAKGDFKHAMAISRAHYHFLQQWRKTAKKRTNLELPFLANEAVYKRSLVWAFFVKKKKKFSELEW